MDLIPVPAKPDMNSREFIFINDEFRAEHVNAGELDDLLSKGWRHFGKYFFRYSIAIHEDRYRLVMPLRIRLERFSLSKSLRRIQKLNSDLSVEFRRARLDAEKQALFDIHKKRFKGHRPRSIFHFLDKDAARVPSPAMEFCLRTGDGRLAAASFADEAKESVSGIYAMFDPAFSRRSLGIHTLLLELEYAISRGKRFYYLGYAYEGSSFYDYKKRFSGIERYDWKGSWIEYDSSP